MSETPTAPPTDAPKPSDIKPPEGKPQDQPETDWKAKYEAQQKVNRDLEGKVSGLQSIARSLGVTPEQGPMEVSVLAATVRELAEEFAASQHANHVLRIATEYGIRDKEAIADLSAVKGEDAMRRMAARIAVPAAQGSDIPSTQPGPRPDLTQGAKGTPASGDPAQVFGNFLSRQLNGG